MKQINGKFTLLNQQVIMNNTFTSCSPEVSQLLKLVDDQEVSCFIEPLDL